MANLKEVRIRITSVNSTRQITSAMKMVSAAKLKRAQDAIVQLRPYANKLKAILSNVSSTLDLSENKFSEQRDTKNVLLIAITSNRGLCGAFNNNVVKETKRLIKGKFEGKNVKVLPLGKKVVDAFKNTDLLYTTDFGAEPFQIFNELNFDNASAIAQIAMDKFMDGVFDEVHVIYNEFKNAAMQIIRAEQFLPMIPVEGGEDVGNVDYIFNPNKEEIVNDMLPKALKLQLFKGLLDSHASEHGARMTAMHQATENAGDLLKELKLTYNKARQASITNEILEISAGAEALNG